MSFDRFLRWYALRNDLLRFHQQKNNTRIGTRTAPTATGAAMIAMLSEDPVEEPLCVIRGPGTAAGEVEVADLLELALVTPFVGEEYDEEVTDVELTTPEIVEFMSD